MSAPDYCALSHSLQKTKIRMQSHTNYDNRPMGEHNTLAGTQPETWGNLEKFCLKPTDCLDNQLQSSDMISGDNFIPKIEAH